MSAVCILLHNSALVQAYDYVLLVDSNQLTCSRLWSTPFTSHDWCEFRAV